MSNEKIVGRIQLNTKRLFKTVGMCLALLALFFVFQKFWVHKDVIFGRNITPSQIFIFLLCAFIYAVVSSLLSVAWFRLLKWYGQSKLSLRQCMYIYARTQIAKYIPGNVFHIGGRHALGYHSGLEHGPLVGAGLYETVGLLSASSILALLGVAFFDIKQQNLSLLTIAAIFVVMFFSPVALNTFACRCKCLKALYIPQKTPFGIFWGLFPIYILYFLFFLFAGSIFFSVAQIVVAEEVNFTQFGSVMTVFSLSWIAGFITPGAPGGVGIREAILVGVLSQFIGEPDSLLVALSFRLMTIIGDFLFFLSSFSFSGKLGDAL